MEEIIVCHDLHPDIEVGKVRTAQEILIEIPEDGVNANTGLVVFINGFNADAYDEYPRKILKPYLANKYNCIVLDSNYFGLRKAGSFWPTESLINNYNIIYSQNINKEKYSKENDDSKIENYLLSQIISELSKKNCTALDLRCQFMIKRKDNSYESWGYIPAIDLLNYAGKLMQKYKLNRKKIILFGMSYGGYIAKLMGKFAPHTFSAIIDKAGFSRIQLEHIVGHEVKRPDYETEFADANGNKKLIYCSYDNPWTIMEYGTRNYFSDANRLIRSLLIERHRQTSDTKYYIFHSVTDDIAPIQDCDREMDILKKYNRVHYERIDASMIGRTIFKSDRHDLSVSTSELFDYVAEIDGSSLEKDFEDNDFTLQSGYTFDCGDRNYVFRYSDDYKVSVHIDKK